MRSRYIKPGFYMNEQLAECSAFARLLFTGLWCLADREGRLEDRPKRIKAQIFPYDDVDGNELLEELSVQGLIIRYEVDGNRYIEIPTFLKHQAPHKNETASVIPPAPKSDQCLTKEQPRQEVIPTMAESTSGQNPLELELELELKLEHEKEKNITSLTGRVPQGAKKPPSECPCEEIAEAYNAQLPELLPVQRLTDARRKTLRARWREDKDRQCLHWWRQLFERVRMSDFLTGRGSQKANPWQADFDWILAPKNLDKILEGKYDNHARAAPKLTLEDALKDYSDPFGLFSDEKKRLDAVEVTAEEEYP